MTQSLNKNKGKLIVIEGLDGSGKTTAQEMCAIHLEKQGFTTTFFKGSSGENNFWKTVLLAQDVMKNANNPMTNDFNQTLHNLDFLNCLNTLNELLQNFDFVICDWYVVSKMMLCDLYCGENSWAKELLKNMFESGHILKPDINIFIDVKPEEAYKRIVARGLKIEGKESLDMLKKANNLWQNYINNYNLYRINGMQNKEDVANEIYAIINKNLIK